MAEPKHAAITALNINWTVRLKNKAWILAMVVAIAVLVQTFLAIFGITWDYSEWTGKIAAIIDAVFVILALVGIVNDPTVDGLTDSERALTYTEPAPNANEVSLVENQDVHIGGTD